MTDNSWPQVFSPTGTPVALWGPTGTAPGTFNDPFDLTVGSAGNAYVADTYNYRIQRLTLAGQPIAQWGTKGSGPGQFLGPTGVAVDSQGDVYATDTANSRIEKFNSTSKLLAILR